jgi:hypothetical protein
MARLVLSTPATTSDTPSSNQEVTLHETRQTAYLQTEVLLPDALPSQQCSSARLDVASGAQAGAHVDVREGAACRPLCDGCCHESAAGEVTPARLGPAAASDTMVVHGGTSAMSQQVTAPHVMFLNFVQLQAQKHLQHDA